MNKKKNQIFTKEEVHHIAHLAHIPVTSTEEENLARGFTATLEVVDILRKIDTDGVEPTHQVTGLQNVFREDVIDASRVLTQQQVLSGATGTYNGYFVVDQVLDKKE